MDDGLIDALAELFGAIVEALCDLIPDSWSEKKRRN